MNAGYPRFPQLLLSFNSLSPEIQNKQKQRDKGEGQEPAPAYPSNDPAIAPLLAASATNWSAGWSELYGKISKG